MLVVGYGKSACDVTVPISAVAASTDVIARQLLWKVPRKINGKLNFKMLLLTRMGEALFKYRVLRGFERFLHGPGNGLRRNMINSIGSVSVRQFGLAKLDLVPAGAMEDIVRGAIGLATEGFFEGVADGTIIVHRDRTIARLYADDGSPFAELSDGSVLPADLVVCSTGFTQGVPFLPADVQRRLLDERGNFLLYRQILPVDVPGLYFNGYNSSFFSPLNAEMAAVWIAADLAGRCRCPTRPRSARDRRPARFHGRRHRRPSLPGHQDHPVLDAQRRRGPGRPRPQHQRRASRLALDQPDQPGRLPARHPDAGAAAGRTPAPGGGKIQPNQRRRPTSARSRAPEQLSGKSRLGPFGQKAFEFKCLYSERTLVYRNRPWPFSAAPRFCEVPGSASIAIPGYPEAIAGPPAQYSPPPTRHPGGSG